MTNEKGRTRKDRANDKYYEGIRNTPYAVFVKLCDRIANVQYGIENGGTMVEKYRTENRHFVQQLGVWSPMENVYVYALDVAHINCQKYRSMFEHLIDILKKTEKATA